ncbi:signal peptidase I [Corynebacterium suicordis]
MNSHREEVSDSAEQSNAKGKSSAAPVSTKVKKEKAEKKTYPWWVEMPIIIVVTLLLLGAFNTFVGRMYLIPSESMEPTLHGCAGCEPDRIFVNKLAYGDGESPEPGEVVVFVGTDSWNTEYTTQRSGNRVIRGIQNAGSYIGLVAPDENTLVKRVIATGGQTVECQEGDSGIKVDGKVLNEPYINNPPTYAISDTPTGSAACGGEFFGPVTVPDGNIWVMGDNRTNSLDSRGHMGDQLQGTIPVDNVVGEVEAIVLPFSRIGGVDSVDNQAA